MPHHHIDGRVDRRAGVVQLLGGGTLSVAADTECVRVTVSAVRIRTVGTTSIAGRFGNVAPASITYEAATMEVRKSPGVRGRSTVPAGHR